MKEIKEVLIEREERLINYLKKLGGVLAEEREALIKENNKENIKLFDTHIENIKELLIINSFITENKIIDNNNKKVIKTIDINTIV